MKFLSFKIVQYVLTSFNLLSTGVFAGSMIRRFGVTSTLLLGTLVSCSGIVVSSFTTSIYAMYVTYGILPGFGFVMMALSSLIAVNEIFDKRQSLAIGVYQAGGSVGGFVFNPVIQNLIETYGWRGALLIMTGVVLHGMFFGLVIFTIRRSGQKATDDRKFNNERKREVSKQFDDEDKPFIAKSDYHRFHLDSFGSMTLYVKPPSKLKDCLHENGHVAKLCNSNGVGKTDTNHLNVSNERNAEYDNHLDSDYLQTEIANGTTVSNHIIISDNEAKSDSKLTKVLAIFHQIFPYTVFSHVPTSIFVIAAGIRAFGFFVPFLLLADFAVDKGVTVEGAAWLASALGISGAVSRVVLGWIGDFPCVDRLYLYILCLIVGGVFSAISPFFDSYGLLMLYACVYGITMGGECSLTPVICNDVAGKSKLPETYGMLQTLCGIGGVCGAPLSGWIFEATGGYRVSFILTGVFITVSGLVLFPLKCHKVENISEETIVEEA